MHELETIAAANGGLVTASEATAAGIDRRRLAQLARDGSLARVARGVYAVGSVLPDPRPIVTATRTTLSHHSAAAWWGADLPAAPGVIHLTASRNRGRRADAIPGARLHRSDLQRHEVIYLRGMPLTTPLRTVVDIARNESLEHGVAIVDAFLRIRLITCEEFVSAASRSAGPGRPRLNQVADLVDDQAGSVLESLTRVLLWRNGLLPSTSQYWIRTQGWAGRVDFAWPERRVVLETDGFEFHASRSSFEADRRRWSELIRAGWQVGVVTWLDVTTDPGYVVRLVRDLLDNEHTAGMTAAS